MRKTLIPLLLATALPPAAAHAEEGSLLGAMRAKAQQQQQQRTENGEARAQRVERVQRSERSESADRPVRVQRVERSDAQPRMQNQQRFERRLDEGRHVRQAQQVERIEPVAQAEPAPPVERRQRTSNGILDGLRTVGQQAPLDRNVRERSDRDHDDGHRERRSGSHRDYHRDLRREHDELHAGDPSRRDHREWHRDAERQHTRRHIAWNTGWRHDSRYDWYGYRHRYGSLFRLGRYYDPYGWGYRRFSIGFSLWPSYYGSSFWLDDPWRYRLPPAYGPYRWIRYYDDALLVNIHTGQVVDVIYNFFW